MHVREVLEKHRKIERKIAESKSESSIFFKVLVEPIIKHGLFRTISPSDWSILSALACFIDKDNTCFPTIELLSQITGVSKTSVVNRLKSLRSKRFRGEKILEITKHKKKCNFANNVYKINPNTGICIFNSNATSLIKEKVAYNYNQNLNNNHNKLDKSKLNKIKKEELGSEILELAHFLVGFDDELEGNIHKAIGRIKFHIQKLGKENWLRCYKISNRTSIYFYNFVTYYVIQKKVPFEKALKMWDEKQK